MTSRYSKGFRSEVYEDLFSTDIFWPWNYVFTNLGACDKSILLAYFLQQMTILSTLIWSYSGNGRFYLLLVLLVNTRSGRTNPHLKATITVLYNGKFCILHIFYHQNQKIWISKNDISFFNYSIKWSLPKSILEFLFSFDNKDF